MTIDRARNSYDASRDWRSVLAQQGRVTLEADVNEQATITGEERRREAIDVIGPVGSPDGGYQVSVNAAGTDVQVGPGTLYLGGWRLTLPATIATAAQPAWLDMPAWPAPAGNQSIALLVTEQTAIAVEDTALQEVALGGPDSAGRLRLLQHVLRLPTAAGTCLDAATALAAYAAANGQTWNPATCQLTSNATLLVTPAAAPAATGPCDPPAQGGYLGADNQMIRVAVTAFDPATGQGKLVWGWNNASFLYRATVAQPNVLNFLADPVDPDHQPQQGQAVEILHCTVDLGDGDRSTSGGGNFIAAGSGVVMTLAAGQGYDSASRQLTLPGTVASDAPRPLFVRLWQAEVAFTANTPVILGGTGLSVTIANPPQPGAIGGRPFWQFAVRPSTPAQVYPQRYLTAPQPPDGPRQFLATLGVVGWSAAAGKFSLIADCVPPFLPLTRQSGGCCAVVLGPAEVAGRGGLQAVVDALAGGPAVVSLRPGTYALAAPLMLGPKHAGLVLEGCSGGVILQAAGTPSTAFLFGLIVLQNVTGITLRRLDLQAPSVALSQDANNAAVTALTGITVSGAQSLVVEDCIVQLDKASIYALGSGILALGALSGIIIRRTRFAATAAAPGAELFGVLVVATGASAATTLDDVQITDCRFQNLLAGVLTIAQLGLIRCSGNVVTGCTTGFYFAEANLGATNSFARQAQQVQAGAGNAAVAQAVGAGYKASLLADAAQKTAPIIAKLLPAPTAPAVSTVAQQALATQAATRGQISWTKLAPVTVPLAATVATAPGATGAAPQAATGAAPPAAIAVTPQMMVAAAPPAATAATPQATTATAVTTVAATQIDPVALNAIDAIALAAETAAPPLTPALRIDANEVTLAATGGTPGVGLAVVLALGGQPGSVLVGGNRVVVPDGNTAACALLFPLAATVTGNLFSQLAAGRAGVPAAASLVVVAESGLLEVAGNVIHPSSYVLPARATTAATGSWEFLNTVL